MEKIRVLIVDDDETTRLLTQEFLVEQGDFEVCGMAADGESCLAAIGRHSPDVVLLDLIMPGMNGVEVLERMRGMERRPKMVVMTGVTGDSMVQQCLALEADHYIMKPVNYYKLPSELRGLFLSDRREGAALALLKEMSGAERLRGLVPAAVAAGLLAQNPDRQMKEVWLAGGQRTGATLEQVERNLRTLIARIHRDGSEEYRRMMGRIPAETPTCEAFLRALATYIKAG